MKPNDPFCSSGKIVYASIILFILFIYLCHSKGRDSWSTRYLLAITILLYLRCYLLLQLVMYCKRQNAYFTYCFSTWAHQVPQIVNRLVAWFVTNYYFRDTFFKSCKLFQTCTKNGMKIGEEIKKSSWTSHITHASYGTRTTSNIKKINQYTM